MIFLSKKAGNFLTARLLTSLGEFCSMELVKLPENINNIYIN
jgi:hypothetical protein